MDAKVFGLKDDSAPIVFLLHGWPDSGELWERFGQVQALSATHQVVVITLPLFGVMLTEAPKGPSFGDLLEMFDQVVETYRKGRKIQLVAHDWGTTLAYLYERKYGKERVEKLVTMDIGPKLKPTVVAIIGIILYQWWLCAMWLFWHYLPVVGQTIGNYGTTMLARFFRAPGASERTLCAAQNYMYINLWLQLFGRKDPKLADLPKNRLPEVPTLFFYGERKPFMFHSPEWLEHLNAKKDGSLVVAVNFGHWLMYRQEQTNAILKKFLN